MEVTCHLVSMITTHQSGYSSNYSCITSFPKIINDIFRYVHKNKLDLLILLDFTEAINRTKHRLLIAFLFIGSSPSVRTLLKILFLTNIMLWLLLVRGKVKSVVNNAAGLHPWSNNYN